MELVAAIEGLLAFMEPRGRYYDGLASSECRPDAEQLPGGWQTARIPRLDLGRDSIPPKPQASLFDALDPGEDDES
jgi:hypothetical protein